MKENYSVVTREIANKDELNAFLAHKKAYDKSPGTIDVYRRTLQNYFTLCPIPLNSITSTQVLDTLKRMTDGHKNSYKHLCIHALSSFFNYCVAEGILPRNLIKSRWLPKLNRTLPRNLTKAEQEALRISAEKLSDKHRVIVEFLLSTGCRCQELCSINRRDFNLRKRTVKIIGKGNKERMVYFDNETTLVIEKYLKTRTDDNPAFIIAKRGKRIGTTSLRQLFKEIVHNAGLRGEVSPHWCRHSYASNMLERGADPSEAATDLGHEDLQTIKTYTHILPEKIISAYYRYKS